MMRFLLAVILLCGVPAQLAAELRPEEVAVIAVRGSAQSIELAEYYVKARGIPPEHICLIDVEPGKSISRAQWETEVRPAIRQWILDGNLETKLRCLVTMWDVPLAIGKSDAETGVVKNRTVYLQGERQNRLYRLRTMIDAVNKVHPGTGDPRPLPEEGDSTQKLIEEFQAAFNDARERVQSIRGTPEGRAANAALGKLYAAGGGLANMLRNYRGQLEKNPGNQNLEKLAATTAGQIAGLKLGRAAILRMPESVERDEATLALIEKSDGVLGTLAWINAQLQLLEKNESYASFDSELSLLYWPNYSLGRWSVNVLHHRYDNSYTRHLRATLMVSRLEAPTVDIVKKLIDTSIAVEKKGLEGKIYLDARGLIKGNEKFVLGSTKDYDARLLNLAKLAKEYTDLDVVLDTKEDLFQPGDAPLAALYCGWYSLANYIDAFEWSPGAVGYHMASSEASTLRKPTSKVWCKRMLEEGVCGTIGPTFEPYLAAFPKPDEFFVLLMSGKHSLVECYYRSKPYNSWVMVLVGDPLYTPFKVNPQFDDKPLPEGLKKLIDGPAQIQP